MSTYLAQFNNTDKALNSYKLGLNPGIAHLAPPLPAKYDGVTQIIPSMTRGGLEAFWSEMILTALFVSVILSAKYLNGATDLFLNAIIIGFTLFTCILTGKSVSGGCYNPAVGLV
jgi:glycerol uptake facilitator-like aquaporin